MAGTPAPPPPPGSVEGPDRSDAAQAAPASERYGPLAVSRNLKDDGRALILYGRVEDAPR